MTVFIRLFLESFSWIHSRCLMYVFWNCKCSRVCKLGFSKQSRIPENGVKEMKETTTGILNKCEQKKVLPEAFIHICHNSISGMHNFKHFYSIRYQHNYQCIHARYCMCRHVWVIRMYTNICISTQMCLGMYICKIYKMMESSLSFF